MESELKELDNVKKKIGDFVYNPNAELTKVVGVEEIAYNGSVFNLEVEDNNNFFVYGILVHNCGDGGAVYFRDPKDYEHALRLSWFGISRGRDLPDVLGERVYNLQEIGFKYHMNNIAAAIGLANIEHAGEILKRRWDIAKIYSYSLKTVQPIHKSNSVFWAYPVRVNDARRFSTYCEGAGVPHSIIHKGIDRNAIFGGVDYSLVNQRWWEKTVVHLPVHHELSPDDVTWICEKVNEYTE